MVAGVPESREIRTGPAFAGHARDDAERRQDWVLRGFRQFDAPVCVIITYDRVLDGSNDTPFDCGAVATFSTRKSVEEAAVFVGSDD